MENWKWNLWREEKNRNGCISNHFAAKFKDKNEMNMCFIFEIKWQIGKQHLYIRSHLLWWPKRINIEKGTSQSTIIHWRQSLHTIYYIEINDRWRCARKMNTHTVSKLAKGFTWGKKIEKFLPFIVDMRAITRQWWQTVWPAFMTKSCRYLICT